MDNIVTEAGRGTQRQEPIDKLESGKHGRISQEAGEHCNLCNSTREAGEMVG